VNFKNIFLGFSRVRSTFSLTISVVGEACVLRPGTIHNFQHNRGVSHGEVRKENVLVSPERMPYLIDLTTATITDPERPGFLFRLQSKMDWYGFLMIKRNLLGQLTEEEEVKARRLRFLASVLRHGVL
jgi:hypothetical protein